MRSGWYKDSYRHSLAARGISTSPRKSFYIELKRTNRPMSKREMLYGEIDVLKNVLSNPPKDLSEERKYELQLQLDNMQSMYNSMTSPRRVIKASEVNNTSAWEERFKGTRGRKPEILGDLALQLNLNKSPQEKHKDYQELLKDLKEERQHDAVIERMNNLPLRDADDSNFQITNEIARPIKRGKPSLDDDDLRFNFVRKRYKLTKAMQRVLDTARGKNIEPKKRKFLKYPKHKTRNIVESSDDKIVFTQESKYSEPKKFIVYTENNPGISSPMKKRRGKEDRYIRGAPIFLLKRRYKDNFKEVSL